MIVNLLNERCLLLQRQAMVIATTNIGGGEMKDSTMMERMNTLSWRLLGKISKSTTYMLFGHSMGSFIARDFMSVQ